MATPKDLDTSTGEARTARLVARTLIVVAAGIMATGFGDWRAGVLVATLTAVTYLLLTAAAPRTSEPPPWRGVVRRLRRHGYRVLPLREERGVAVGTGGIYLLEMGLWRHTVGRSDDGRHLDDPPVRRVAERVARHARRLERVLAPHEPSERYAVVPVVTVADRLPEPVMWIGRTVIAVPEEAVRYILSRPDTLDAEEIDTVVARIRSDPM